MVGKIEDEPTANGKLDLRLETLLSVVGINGTYSPLSVLGG